MDKIHICLDLLMTDGRIENKGTLRETYEEYLGIYKIERNDPEMWKMVWDHKILSLFQMEQQSGIRGIALAKPQSVEDLAHLNSVIRLMAQEKGGELPLEKYSRFKQNINLWYEEMEQFGLTKQEQQILVPLLQSSYGICESQEQFMMLVQLKECGGYNLNWADKLRKAIAKKNPAGFDALEKEFYENIDKLGLSYNFCNYVWKVLVSTSKGYGFNLSHTLAYSLVALQEMNLAYNYPSLYWDCACLISDSGSNEDSGDKSTDYEKIAKAIGMITSKGVEVSLININTSDYGFIPDVENNRILYGLKAISGINAEIIEMIKAGRPYTGITDFMDRCGNLGKVVMINLIKAGAFDEIDVNFNGDRKLIMAYYASKVSGPKSRLTLQNFNGLIQKNLIPQELELQIRVFNFTKYLKGKKIGKYYVLDEISIEFLSNFLPDVLDDVETINGVLCILQDVWTKKYSKYMDAARDWLKANQQETLDKYNQILFKDWWQDNAAGNLSKWEMSSLCFYHSGHELATVDPSKYGVSNFLKLPSVPEVDYFFEKGRNKIPIYKLTRIMGTVIAKNDNKATVTLLTTSGVVDVKFSKEYYAMFKRQISQVKPDGTKKVVEKGWFTRGNMLLITGYRRDDQFVAKNYKSTGGHQLYKIDEVKDSMMMIRHERSTVEDAYFEENEE